MADLGFIADLWFDRSEEPNKPMRLVDIIKASFGGDRSAAGRYAAEQRWKNHQKKKEDKKGIFVSSALRNQLSLSRDALKNFENDGGSLRRYPDVLSKEDDKALSAEITKLWLQADKFGRRLEESSDFSEEPKRRHGWQNWRWRRWENHRLTNGGSKS